MTLARLAVAAAAFSIVGLTASAHAQAWRPTIEANCVKQIGEQRGHWPAWAKCVVQHLYGWNDEVQEHFNRCWVPVWNEYLQGQFCNLCGDPVRSVVNCTRRGLGR